MKKGRAADPVAVGGITPLTTIDYPGELACVLYLQGCPWRCGYCHNHHLDSRNRATAIPWPSIVEFLARRTGLLDAVVFSGGEPTLHANLDRAMCQVSRLGFKIGLHTAGIYPRRLRRVLPLVDWVGMDIKSTRDGYDAVTGVRGSGARAWQSAELVMDSGVDYEFRTTVHPDLLSPAHLARLADQLSACGVRTYAVQKCVTRNCRDESLRSVSADAPEADYHRLLAHKFDRFRLRND